MFSKSHPTPSSERVAMIRRAVQRLRFTVWFHAPDARKLEAERLWAYFQKFVMMCRDLAATRLLVKALDQYNDRDMFYHAWRALGDRNEPCLKRLIDYAQDLLNTRQKAITECFDRLKARYDGSPDLENDWGAMQPLDHDQAPFAPVSDEWLGVPLSSGDHTLSCSKLSRGDRHTMLGVFKYRVCHDETLYTLLTPVVVSAWPPVVGTPAMSVLTLA